VGARSTVERRERVCHRSEWQELRLRHERDEPRAGVRQPALAAPAARRHLGGAGPGAAALPRRGVARALRGRGRAPVARARPLHPPSRAGQVLLGLAWRGPSVLTRPLRAAGLPLFGSEYHPKPPPVSGKFRLESKYWEHDLLFPEAWPAQFENATFRPQRGVMHPVPFRLFCKYLQSANIKINQVRLVCSG